MNWKRIAIYVVVLLIVPELIGFFFGLAGPVLEPIFRDGGGWSEGRHWAKRVAMSVAMGVVYSRLAFTQAASRAAHVGLVFVITHVLFVVLGGVIYGNFGLNLGWFAAHLLSATAGALFGLRLALKQA